MLWKLSLTGIKSRLRDYLVLFSGLVMASAIFYMFESMASNEAFLKSNTIVAATVIIFRFGSVLLGIITFVYILYANSFLMTMRQKDYAMFMMLGAKGRKIAQMIFSETFLVGIAATLVGSAVGVGLTSIVHRLLVDQLDLNISHFTPFSIHGLLITVLFFAVLFLLAAVVNAFSIVKKPILALIRADQTPTRIKQHKFLFFLEVVLGIAFLGCGYYMMKHVGHLSSFWYRSSLSYDRIGYLFHFPFCDHFLFIITKEIRTDFIEKIEQFHIVTVKLSYS